VRLELEQHAVPQRYGGTANEQHATLRLAGALADGDYLALAAAWSHAGAPADGAFETFDAPNALLPAAMPSDTFDLYHYVPSHCGYGNPQGSAPTVGDTAQLTWIDRYGRVVPVASAVRVVAP
jgi:hypothetical protein